MIKVVGKETGAKIYSENRQETAIEQIEELCNQSFMKDLKIRIMPDYHAGKGCVIGTTIKLEDKVVPNLVGVDIGCGILVVGIGKEEIDFAKLDSVIREHVPNGANTHEKQNENRDYDRFDSINFIADGISNIRTNLSLGTLGGGNHFIEVSVDDEGNQYLLIHTGSRYVGAKVAKYHQKKATDSISIKDVSKLIESLKEQNRHSEIQSELKKYQQENPPVPKDLAYLDGQLFNDYIHDMKLAQAYAIKNRLVIANTIINHMNFEVGDMFDSIHNYIDTENMILRKGATSAQEGERLVIPINMRDGSIIAIGKGNADWNYSAPHGAGRVLSRTQANKQLNLEDFKSTMGDVWTTSVNEETLDESPMAYKSMEEIKSQIGDTVDILKIVKPIYNFKASDKFVKTK